MCSHTKCIFSDFYDMLCYDPKELLQGGEDKKLLTGECDVLKVTFMKELLNVSSKCTMALLSDVHCGFQIFCGGNTCIVGQ